MWPLKPYSNSKPYLFIYAFEHAGRRSRRNSFTEDSQLTIENFGGSQDQINMIGRTVELERKYSNSTLSHVTEPTVALRSSVADARGTLQLGYNEPDSGSGGSSAVGSGRDTEKQDRDTEKRSLRRQGSSDNVSLAQIAMMKQHEHSHAVDETVVSAASSAGAPSIARHIDDGNGTAETIPPQVRKKTSFSTIPNTTTWQQQQLIYQQNDNNGMVWIVMFDNDANKCVYFVFIVDDEEPLIDLSKLSGIRMKLEEKRRHIELEKRRLEIQFSKQQQKVGKAAFLQAINKVRCLLTVYKIVVNNWTRYINSVIAETFGAGHIVLAHITLLSNTNHNINTFLRSRMHFRFCFVIAPSFNLCHLLMHSMRNTNIVYSYNLFCLFVETSCVIKQLGSLREDGLAVRSPLIAMPRRKYTRIYTYIDLHSLNLLASMACNHIRL